MPSMSSTLIRFARSYASLKAAGVCCLMMFATAIAVNPAVGAIDGYVEGFAEGYTSEYDVSFITEDKKTGDGGKLYLSKTSVGSASTLNIGFIAPLNICDNTFGDNRSPGWTDIGKNHNLKDLEGSDDWQMKREPPNDDDKWILEYVDDTYSGSVKEFSVAGLTLGEFQSSLGWNYDYDPLNDSTYPYRTYFDNENSPALTVNGPFDYSFPGADNWIAEIMYEFQLQWDNTVTTFGESDFVSKLFKSETKPKGKHDEKLEIVNGSVFHMSPNMLGAHKVFVEDVVPSNVIPEPSTFIVWGLLVMTAVGGSYWRRKRAAA